MYGKPVEWVLVVCYGSEAHRATYGRHVQSNRYTKDYIQLSRRKEFLNAMRNLFSLEPETSAPVQLIYHWPKGTAPGSFVFSSADRAHLKWDTHRGAPRVWKMTPVPNEATAETIPGDPSHDQFEDAEAEFAKLSARGAGQPYLIAVKLRGEPRALHLRAYLGGASPDYAWAALNQTPGEIQDLATSTRPTKALAWRTFNSGGVAPSDALLAVLSKLATVTEAKDRDAVLDTLDTKVAQTLAEYLRQPGYGMFFNPRRNHDPWFSAPPLPTQIVTVTDELLRALAKRPAENSQGDVTAETADFDAAEEEDLQRQFDAGDYTVEDATATAKTRGSAQRVFARAVKSNYGHQCALTGISTPEFLVASHIVPWSKDKTTRLDPSNGICLSLLVDRAFEDGFLVIKDDLTVVVNHTKIGGDSALYGMLTVYDGHKLTPPSKHPPRSEYLQRRRALVGMV